MQGYNVGSYTSSLYIVAGIPFAGLTAGNWSVCLYTDLNTLCHELGHQLGLAHASSQWNIADRAMATASLPQLRWIIFCVCFFVGGVGNCIFGEID